MFNTPAHLEDVNTQKEIQLLRLKTQYALAESRIEIERLEDENEIKNHRIREIELEIEEMEEEAAFGNMESLRKLQLAPPVQKGMKRRWSLSASLGMTNKHEEKESEYISEKRGQVHVDEQYQKLEITAFGRRMSLGGLGGNQSFLQIGFGGQTKRIAEETFMQKLHAIQLDNKKAVEGHENDLNFKELQVLAMRMTFESQEKIIAKLQADIAKLTTENIPPPPADDTPGKISSKESLGQKLSNQIGQVYELEANIRAIRLIQKMDDAERQISANELTKKIEGFRAKLILVKEELIVSSGILQREVDTRRKVWMGVTLQLGIMDRVSQKCVSRLKRKALDGDTRSMPTILERATRALGDEFSMREQDTENAGNLRKELEFMERLSNAVLKIGISIADGVFLLQSKEISEELAEIVLSTLEVVKECVEVVQSSMGPPLVAIEELEHSYERDNMLLTKELQEDIKRNFKEQTEKIVEVDLAQSCGLGVDDIELCDDLGHAHEPEISEQEHNRIAAQEVTIEKLRQQERDLQERMEAVTAKIIETKTQEKDEGEEWTRKIQTLKVEIKKLEQEWSYKDQQIGVSHVKVEALKNREDLLREILEAATAWETPKGLDD